MLLQNLVLYEDKYFVRVNAESDPLFYFFDYDVRSADINMQFQHFHTFYELCILLCPSAVHFIEGVSVWQKKTASCGWFAARKSAPP